MKNSRIMIDTNIFLDVMLEREGLCDGSAALLQLCEDRLVTGFVSASCVTDIFYIVRKHLHSTDAAYLAIGKVLDIASVCDVTNSDVLLAFEKRSRDFEDCLLSVCARSAKCECIITRNTADFAGYDVPAFTPEEWMRE